MEFVFFAVARLSGPRNTMATSDNVEDVHPALVLLEERVLKEHPLAAIADRIYTAFLLAGVLRKRVEAAGGETARDRAMDAASATVDRAARGIDELAVLLLGQVPHPRDDAARAIALVERLHFAAEGLGCMPTDDEVEVVTDRLFALASADVAAAKAALRAALAARQARTPRPEAASASRALRVERRLPPSAVAVAVVLCGLKRGERMKTAPLVVEVKRQCRRTVSQETIRGFAYKRLRPLGMTHERGEGYYIEPSLQPALRRLVQKHVAAT